MRLGRHYGNAEAEAADKADRVVLVMSVDNDRRQRVARGAGRRSPAAMEQQDWDLAAQRQLSHAVVMPRRTTEAVPDTRHRASRRLVATALVVMSMQLTACASAPSTDTGYDTWAAQMRAVVSDSNGIGGAGGSGPGSVELDYMRIGKWVVYAVCGHTDVVHVTVRGGGTILAATDVACGATVALPIAVDSTTVRHFEIQASRPKGASGEGWWEARVNRVSWQQSGIFVFK